MADEYLTTALYGIKTFNKKVEEKVGIMKLLDIINEYETPRSGIVFKSYDDYDGTLYGVDCDGETEIAWSDTYVCGKRFGFINRLIENDKIDISKTPGHFIYHYTDEDKEKEALMHLAIQDEPIKFLLSILK